MSEPVPDFGEPWRTWKNSNERLHIEKYKDGTTIAYGFDPNNPEETPEYGQWEDSEIGCDRAVACVNFLQGCPAPDENSVEYALVRGLLSGQSDSLQATRDRMDEEQPPTRELVAELRDKIEKLEYERDNLYREVGWLERQLESN